MIDTVFIELILGAMTGYVTNDIAIKQLFRDGGIIEKERDEFTKALVQLLEEEIFPEEVVIELFSNEKVQQVFQEMTREFVDEVLPRNLADLSLQDLPSHAQAEASLLAYLNNEGGIYRSWIDGEMVRRKMQTLIDEGFFVALLEKSLEKWQGESLVSLYGEEKWAARRKVFSERFNDYNFWQGKVVSGLDRLLHSNLSLGELSQWDVEALFERLNLWWQEEQTQAFLKRWREEGKTKANFVLEDPFVKRSLAHSVDLLFPIGFSYGSEFLLQKKDVLEGLFVESVAEALGDFNATIRSSIIGGLESYFKTEVDGQHWLNHLLIRYCTPKAQESWKEKAKEAGQKILWEQLTATADGKEIPEDLRAYETEIKGLLAKILDTPIKEVLAQKEVYSWCVNTMEKMIFQVLNTGTLEHYVVQFVDKFAFLPLGEWLLKGRLCEAIVLKTNGALASLCEKELGTWVEALETNPLWGEKINQKLLDKVSEQSLAKAYDFIIPSERRPEISASLAEQIQGFLEKNLPKILGNITYNHMSELSQEEIREVIREVLGREMRPLSYLGGFVGGVAGLATGLGLSQMDQADLAQWNQAGIFALRSAFYGAVGYGTNVLAIHSLFKPYRKTLGWQGLIPKNQYRFANKMAEMTEKYILNEEIWQSELGKFSLQSKAYIEKSLPYLRDGVLLSGLEKYIDFRGDWLNRPVAELFQDSFKEEFAAFSDRALARFLAAEDNQTRVADFLKARLCPQITGMFLDHDSWLYSLLGEKWQELDREKLVAILTAALDEKIQSFVASLSEQDVDNWVKFGNKGLSYLTFPEKNGLYEWLWQKFVPFYERIPEYARAREADIAALITERLKKDMSFSMSLMFKMIGGEKYILKTVEIFVEEKLPFFLHEVRADIEALWYKLCENELKGKTLLDLGYQFTGEEICLWQAKLADTALLERVGVRLQAQGHRLLEKYLLDDALGEKIFASRAWQDYLATPEFKVKAEVFVQEKVLSAYRFVLTRAEGKSLSDFTALWNGALAQEIGTWPIRTFITNEKLAQLEQLVKGESIGANHPLKKAIEAYLGDGLYLIIPSVYQIFSDYGEALVREMNVPHITYRQIMSRNPENLEKLMRSIGNPYFKHVEKMGLWGAVVAIPASAMALFLS